MPEKRAAENEVVKTVRKTILEETDFQKIFVQWEDRKFVKMIIEGDQILKKEKFNDLVGDDLPHGVFDYDTYPQNKLVDWAETHILFHV